MDTSRNDFGIAIRSALLAKGAQQKFSLFALVILSITLIFFETIDLKPLNYLRSFIKDTVYKSSEVISFPVKGVNNIFHAIGKHMNLNSDHKLLLIENKELKNNTSKLKFLELENTQLRKLIDEEVASSTNLVSARVILDKKSPYLNSFIINIGSNKEIKNGMAVLDGFNFIGRIVDVNFFSSRVLLVSDLNSKIPILIAPSGVHAILSGRGKREPLLEYLPKDHNIRDGNKIYTSGKEGVFSPGVPIGEVNIKDNFISVSLFSDLNQITFVNVNLEYNDKSQ
jgi:rod shape-determining protein MreC